MTASGNVKMLGEVEHVLAMTNGMKIPIEDIRLIEGDLFRGFEEY